MVYVFVTAGHSGALGALITFAPDLWYPIYGARTAAWGLSALEDQQLAGLIMWIPAGALFTILGIALFAAWLGETERRVALTRSESLRKGARTSGPQSDDLWSDDRMVAGRGRPATADRRSALLRKEES